jgi:SAM-dependent methyltransferase
MDIFTALSRNTDYSKNQLQVILGAWVATGVLDGKTKITQSNGHVEEGDYDKRSIYSLLYALYRSMGEVKAEDGKPYEFTFNTWGYAWPKSWGAPPNNGDPQRYGRNAYSGLYHFDAVKKYVAERKGKVHVVEMGCGTGAGAHHVCTNVLPNCTYEAIDMQAAAIKTANRKFVPGLQGRLKATQADATQLPVPDATADIVAVNETHITEWAGIVGVEDKQFFHHLVRVLKPGGFMVWGNAIPEATWEPSFEYLESLGMKLVENCDVTLEAIQARDEDKARIDAYADQCFQTFHAFRIPFLAEKKRLEADAALKNFARNPGTKLYDVMVDRTHTYRVVCLQKQQKLS